MKKLLLAVLFAVVFLLTSSSSIHAATYCTTDSGNCYVDGVGGLDTNNGKTTTTAWKTIQMAATTVGAGDTVNVKGGITYTGSNSCGMGSAVVCFKTSGSAGNYITYQAWPGTGTPIIDASSVSNGFCSFTIQWIVISGFRINNAGVNATSENNIAGIAIEHNSTVKNNIIYNSYSKGIANFSSNGGHNIQIYNNTIVDGNRTNIYSTGIYAQSPNADELIYNNIIVNYYEGLNRGYTGTYNNDYNLFYGNVSNYNSGLVPGVHDVYNDPLFVDTASGDLRLKKNSPAINAGTDLTSSGVVSDILGVVRPQGSAYDMGAYEYYDIPVTLTSVPASSSNVSSPSFTGTSSTIGAATISSISYSVDGGGWSTSGVSGTDTFAITIPFVPDGTHTVRVRATDSYGNSSDSSLMGISTFYINTITTKGPPVCGNLITSATPNLFEIRTNKTTARLFFTPPIPPYSSFYIAYSTKPDSIQYGVEYNQSYSGNGGVLNYTINMLQPGTKYYFTIRAGNGCTTGSWGNTLTAVTTTSTIQRTYYKNFPIVINNLLPKK